MPIVRIISCLAAIAFGVFVIAKTEPFVRFIGKSGWAENKLGPGGSYTMWKIGGLIVIIIAGAILFGVPKPFKKNVDSTAVDSFNLKGNQPQDLIPGE